jgi:hypothetical protein
MVIHYQPGRLRRNSDQPTAVTDVLVATSGSSSRTGDIPLGTPTCSARTRHGRWALYPHGTEVVVVWPGGALVGPPVEVAGELDRLGGDRYDDLDPVVGNPDTDVVEPGRRLLAQRPRQPARPRHPHAGQMARRTGTCPTDSAARSSARADPGTSRLTAHTTQSTPYDRNPRADG